jgi:hypothetical protein
MKNLLCVFAILLVLSLTEKVSVLANSTERVVPILKDKTDITGDGQKDIIILSGVKREEGHYKNLNIEIVTTNKKRYKIHLPQGLKPEIQLLDVNRDGVKDLFTTIPINKDRVNSKQILYTLKNNQLVRLSLPESLVLESGFLNGYKAKVKVKNTGNTYVFNLKNRKKYYEKLGVFYKGKLNEPTELMVSEYSNMKPVLIKPDKIGLKGIQKITGVAESDTIGYVESSWLYDQSRWKLIKVAVLKKI